MEMSRAAWILYVFLGSHVIIVNTYEAEILPENDVVLLEGALLELRCRSKSSSCRGDVPGIPELYFNHRGTDLLALPSGNCSVTLQVPNVTREHHGIYNCFERKSDPGSKQRVAMSKLVTVLDSKEPNLTCIIDNFEAMECEWCNSNGTSAYTDIEWNDRDGLNICQKMVSSCKCHICGSKSITAQYEYMECSGDNVKQFIQNKRYDFTLSQRDGTKTEPYSFDANMRYVKPAAVGALKEVGTNSTSISINWTHPNQLSSSLDYTLTYTSEGRTIQVYVGKQTFAYTITNLPPDRDVNVTVWGTPTGGLYPGVARSITARTAEAAPGKPPRVFPGAFRILGTEGLEVFWQSVSEQQNGVIRGYNVTVYSPVGDDLMVTADAGDHRALLVSVNGQAGVNVTISAHTGAGSSPDAVIAIGKELPPSPESAVADRNGTHVNFSWVAPPGINVTNYTLLECSTETCRGPITKYVIAGNRTKYVLPYYNSTRWYAISTNTHSTSSGFGLQWICAHHRSHPVPVPGLHLSRVRGDRIEVTVQASSRGDCHLAEGEGRTSQYQLTWTPAHCLEDAACPVSDEGSAKISATTRTYTIRGLKDYAYNVTLAGIGMAGTGPMVSKSADAFQAQSYTGLKIMGAVFAGVIIMVIVIMSLRRVSKYLKSNTPQPIHPDLPSSFPHDINSGKRAGYDRYSPNGDLLANNHLPDVKTRLLHDESYPLPDHQQQSDSNSSIHNIYEDISYSKANETVLINNKVQKKISLQRIQVINDSITLLDLEFKTGSKQILPTNGIKGNFGFSKSEQLIPKQQYYNQQNVRTALEHSGSGGYYKPGHLIGTEHSSEKCVVYDAERRNLSCPEMGQLVTMKAASAGTLKRASNESVISEAPLHIDNCAIVQYNTTEPLVLFDLAELTDQAESSPSAQSGESSAEYKAVGSTLSIHSGGSSEGSPMESSVSTVRGGSCSPNGYKPVEFSLSMQSEMGSSQSSKAGESNSNRTTSSSSSSYYSEGYNTVESILTMQNDDSS